MVPVDTASSHAFLSCSHATARWERTGKRPLTSQVNDACEEGLGLVRDTVIEVAGKSAAATAPYGGLQVSHFFLSMH